ncbi:MAG: YbaB/EbfC family nucleoid-associated protein [Helicobacteraceae bacterium]|jgi:DNA-binding YbaB/EbfC family protein|nr:YbaB/EbfC family nucleoid-associated protein [Helicobacteraceae bacterium]
MFENLNLGNMGELFTMAQQKAREMQESAENSVYTAKSGGGLVKVAANGKGEIVDLEIDDSLLEDKRSLVILLITAFNEATERVESAKREAAMKMMGDFANLKPK